METLGPVSMRNMITQTSKKSLLLTSVILFSLYLPLQAVNDLSNRSVSSIHDVPDQTLLGVTRLLPMTYL